MHTDGDLASYRHVTITRMCGRSLPHPCNSKRAGSKLRENRLRCGPFLRWTNNAPIMEQYIRAPYQENNDRAKPDRANAARIEREYQAHKAANPRKEVQVGEGTSSHLPVPHAVRPCMHVPMKLGSIIWHHASLLQNPAPVRSVGPALWNPKVQGECPTAPHCSVEGPAHSAMRRVCLTVL